VRGVCVLTRVAGLLCLCGVVDGPRAVTRTAASVLREHLAPGVVVLAGCATATGADVESWSGLPSAFLAVGSSSKATAQPRGPSPTWG